MRLRGLVTLDNSYLISKSGHEWIVLEESPDPGEEGDLVDLWLSGDDLQCKGEFSVREENISKSLTCFILRRSYFLPICPRSYLKL